MSFRHYECSASWRIANNDRVPRSSLSEVGEISNLYVATIIWRYLALSNPPAGGRQWVDMTFNLAGKAKYTPVRLAAAIDFLRSSML